MLTGGIGDSGEARWEYFRNVVAVPSIKKTGGALRCASPCRQPLLRAAGIVAGPRLACNLFVCARDAGPSEHAPR